MLRRKSKPDIRFSAAAALALGGAMAIPGAMALVAYDPALSALHYMAVGAVFGPVVVGTAALIIGWMLGGAKLGWAMCLMINAACGAVVWALTHNGRADGSALQKHTVRLLDKGEAPFGLAGLTQGYTVTVSPWGPNGSNRRKILAPRTVYDRAKPGDSLVLTTRPGAIGIEWIVGFDD